MELTLSQLKQFTSGTVSVERIDGAIHFHRFTPRQVESFGKMHPDFYPRSKATAGCRIDFHTDSDMLCLKTAVTGKYEVMINGLPRFRFLAHSAQELTAAIEPGEKHITIVLPSHSEGILHSVCVADGASLRPYTYQKRFLFLGDSITQGWDSRWDCLSYAWQVSTYYHADSMILGVGGSYFEAETLENVGFDPDVVFIAYGTNDLFHFSSMNALQNACRTYLGKINAMYPSKKVFCITPLWRRDQVSNIGTLEEVRKIIATEASQNGFCVIPGEEMVPASSEFFADEDLHPNDLGFSLYASNLIRAIDPLL